MVERRKVVTTLIVVVGCFLVMQGIVSSYLCLYQSGIWTLSISSCCDFWLNKHFLDSISLWSHISIVWQAVGLLLMVVGYLRLRES